MHTRFNTVRTAVVLLLGLLLVQAATATQENNGVEASAVTVTELDAHQGTETTITVAVRASAPFLIPAATSSDAQTGRDAWTGIAGDLWTRVEAELAETAGVRTVFVEYDTLSEQLAAVESGTADLALGGITVTAERERVMDFTHPMLSDGLAIAVPAEHGPAWLSALRALISPQFFAAVGALFTLLLVVGFVVWLLERRGNPEQFGGKPAHGLASGFWWSAVTMTTVGYGDKAPATFLGRSVALVWMFASIIIISSMTAAIASALTISSLGGRVQDASDLPGARVGTIQGSAPEAYLRRVGARPVYADTPAELVQRLDPGNASSNGLDAVVYDGPILRYLINESGVSAAVLPGTVEPARYAWALPSGSPYREAINRAILDATATPEWRETLHRYLGND